MNPDHVETPAKKTDRNHGGLIALLERLQATYGYLPEERLREIARETGRSLLDVYGVATFYKAFSLKPRGKHLTSVCLGTACHVQGGPRIAEAFQKELRIESGETTPDREFSLETVNCLGACALGPVVVTNEAYVRHMTASKVDRLLKRLKRERT